MTNAKLACLMMATLFFSGCEILSKTSDRERETSTEINKMSDKIDAIESDQKQLNDEISNQQTCLNIIVDLIKAENKLDENRANLAPLQRKWDNRNIEDAEKVIRNSLIEKITQTEGELRQIKDSLNTSCKIAR